MATKKEIIEEAVLAGVPEEGLAEKTIPQILELIEEAKKEAQKGVNKEETKKPEPPKEVQKVDAVITKDTSSTNVKMVKCRGTRNERNLFCLGSRYDIQEGKDVTLPEEVAHLFRQDGLVN